MLCCCLHSPRVLGKARDSSEENKPLAACIPAKLGEVCIRVQRLQANCVDQRFGSAKVLDKS